MVVRLLCLDGGGVRGVLQARLLERLGREGALSGVSHVAGSSIGAVNAAWVSMEKPLAELVALYRTTAPFIFSSGGIMASALGAKAAQAAFRATLGRYLGKRCLGDLAKPFLAGAVGKDGPVFFDSLRDHGVSLVDVILAATAAVPALPAHKGLVDGGLVTNDPSAVALAWLGTLGHKDCLLSIGTGRSPTRPTTLLGGLLKAATTGQDVSTLAQCTSALGARYHRLQIELPREIGLSESKAVDELIEIADAADLEETTHWVDRYFVD